MVRSQRDTRARATKAKQAWQGTKKKEREHRKGQPSKTMIVRTPKTRTLKSMIANENEDEDCENTEDRNSSDDDTRCCAMRVKPIQESNPTSMIKHFTALSSMDPKAEDNPKDDAAMQFNQ